MSDCEFQLKKIENFNLFKVISSSIIVEESFENTGFVDIIDSSTLSANKFYNGGKNSMFINDEWVTSI